jgi:hypothetical protein
MKDEAPRLWWNRGRRWRGNDKDPSVVCTWWVTTVEHQCDSSATTVQQQCNNEFYKGHIQKSRDGMAVNDCRMLNDSIWLGFEEHDRIVSSSEGRCVPVTAVSGLALPEFHN